MSKNFSLPDWVFFLLLIALSVAFYKIISPFIIDIFLATLLTHLFRKLFNILKEKTKLSKNASSLLTMLCALFLLIIPLIIVGLLLSNEAANTYFTIKEKWPQIQELLSTDTMNFISQRFPAIANQLDSLKQLEFQKQLSQIFSTGAEIMLNLIQTAFLNLSFMFFHLVLILILMYFLLIDGNKLLARILYLSPLKDSDEKELINEIIKIVDATLLGTTIIALIEGIYGGIIFALFGIPSALFWGVIMMFFSMVPIIGINTILIPTGFVLIILGNVWAGILILALSWGGTTITQNYLKPYMVGKRGGLHPAIVLLSTLGGLAWFGLVGFLIGPILASLFMAIWNQFGQRYKSDLEGWNANG